MFDLVVWFLRKCMALFL